jgi:hypothetical protein
MPTTIRVLSWNVESLGETKAYANPQAAQPAQSAIVQFISQVITTAQADLVGLMEIKGGIGKQLMAWLLAELNNALNLGANPLNQWQGRLSSRQDGGTQEEYLFLWQNQANVLTLDPNGSPGPTALIGVADLNVLENVIQQQKWTPEQATQLLQALSDSGYLRNGRYKSKSLTRTLRVVPDQWNTLYTATQPATVTFKPTPARQPPKGFAANAAARQALATQLVNIDILRFTTYAERSPYVGNFLVGNGGNSLMVALLHAPGPREFPGVAVNVMGLSLPLQQQVQQRSLLVMGDFNVPTTNMGRQELVYGRFQQGSDFVFNMVTPRQRVQVFEPLTGNAPGFGATDLLPAALTSLTNAYLPDNTSIASTLCNAYDKLFFKGSTTAGQVMTQTNATVLNLVAMVAANQGNFNQQLGTSALTHFRAYPGSAFLTKAAASLTKKLAKADREVTRFQKQLNSIPLPHPPPVTDQAMLLRYNKANLNLQKAQAKSQELTNSQNNIGAVVALVNNALAQTPTGIGTGLAIYRFSISDHLPVMVDITAT